MGVIWVCSLLTSIRLGVICWKVRVNVLRGSLMYHCVTLPHPFTRTPHPRVSTMITSGGGVGGGGWSGWGENGSIGDLSCSNLFQPVPNCSTCSNLNSQFEFIPKRFGISPIIEFKFEWRFYALSASEAIFRVRTYSHNLFSPVVMMTSWRKLGGNLPPEHDALLFLIRGMGSFICPAHCV